MGEPLSGWTMALDEAAKTQYEVHHGVFYGAPVLGTKSYQNLAKDVNRYPA